MTSTLNIDFGTVFHSLPTAFLVMDREFNAVEANSAYLKLLGLRREDLIGAAIFELFPPTPDSLDSDGNNPVEISFKKARDTGVVDVMPIQKYDIKDPVSGVMTARYWSLISAPVLGPDNDVVLVMQRTEDVTEFVLERDASTAHEKRDRDQALRITAMESDLYARAQELMAAQQARNVTADRLARLGEVALQLTKVNTLEALEEVIVGRGLSVLDANGGALVSPAEDGGWRLTVNVELGETARTVYGLLPYDSALPACVTARTGNTILLPTHEAGLAFSEEMVEVYKNTERYGWAFVPMAIGSTVLGSLAVAWNEEHEVNAEELALISGFAAQCAQALERIRAADAEREAAETAQRMSESLQRSLLTTPAIVEPLDLAVRYQPASELAQVGGDWYDAFVTTSGSTILVVGDVTGHDRTAAATMGQFRNILRGLAFDSTDSPARLLSRLDGALRGLEIDSLATAVLARIEEVRTESGSVWRMEWSNAGHLPPIMRSASGDVTVLEREFDLMLGLDPSVGREDHEVFLTPGSTVVLYTDGLVERRNNSLDVGIASIVEILAQTDGSSYDVCEALLTMTHRDTNHDDIALLGLSVPVAVETSRTEVSLQSNPQSAGEARRLIREVCSTYAIRKEAVDLAELLASEVVTNAVLYGLGGVVVRVDVNKDRVLVEVSDSNTAPPVMQPRDTEATGGRGVAMLEVAASEWGTRSNSDGKTVWFTVANTASD